MYVNCTREFCNVTQIYRPTSLQGWTNCPPGSIAYGVKKLTYAGKILTYEFLMYFIYTTVSNERIEHRPSVHFFFQKKIVLMEKLDYVNCFFFSWAIKFLSSFFHCFKIVESEMFLPRLFWRELVTFRTNDFPYSEKYIKIL